jgi:hypothetical protein
MTSWFPSWPESFADPPSSESSSLSVPDPEEADALLLPLELPEEAVDPLEPFPAEVPEVPEEVPVLAEFAGPVVGTAVSEVTLAPALPVAVASVPCTATVRGRSESRGAGVAAKEAANADNVRDAASAAVTPMTVVHRRMTRLPFDRRRRRSRRLPARTGPTIVPRGGETSLRTV